jgi:hypothetical protein
MTSADARGCPLSAGKADILEKVCRRPDLTLSGLPQRVVSWLEQDLFSGEEAHWRMPTVRLCIGGWLACHWYDVFGPYVPLSQ